MADENDDVADATEVDPFETSLRAFLDSPKGAKHRLKARRIRKFLDMKPSAKRTKFLERFKAHVATQLHQDGVTDTADVSAIDWQNINWDKVIETLTKIFEFIMKIIPLFT